MLFGSALEFLSETFTREGTSKIYSSSEKKSVRHLFFEFFRHRRTREFLAKYFQKYGITLLLLVRWERVCAMRPSLLRFSKHATKIYLVASCLTFTRYEETLQLRYLGSNSTPWEGVLHDFIKFYMDKRKIAFCELSHTQHRPTYSC